MADSYPDPDEPLVSSDGPRPIYVEGHEPRTGYWAFCMLCVIAWVAPTDHTACVGAEHVRQVHPDSNHARRIEAAIAEYRQEGRPTCGHDPAGFEAVEVLRPIQGA